MKVVYGCVFLIIALMFMTGISCADIAAQLHGQLYPKGFVPDVPVFTGPASPMIR